MPPPLCVPAPPARKRRGTNINEHERRANSVWLVTTLEGTCLLPPTRGAITPPNTLQHPPGDGGGRRRSIAEQTAGGAGGAWRGASLGGRKAS